MDIIKCILEGFKEYIHEKNIIEGESKIVLTYVPLPYDLVDEDLDFDEVYYNDHLMVNLDKIIDSNVMNIFQTNEKLLQVVVNKGKMRMRNQIVTDRTVEYNRLSKDSVEVNIKCIRSL